MRTIIKDFEDQPTVKSFSKLTLTIKYKRQTSWILQQTNIPTKTKTATSYNSSVIYLVPIFFD
ncbi:6020_t:CDS:2 [Rhizophagus irregularis]|nr:6020_t:CDS:2 [Rhizophagus irregularis]